MLVEDARKRIFTIYLNEKKVIVRCATLVTTFHHNVTDQIDVAEKHF